MTGTGAAGAGARLRSEYLGTLLFDADDPADVAYLDEWDRLAAAFFAGERDRLAAALRAALDEAGGTYALTGRDYDGGFEDGLRRALAIVEGEGE